MNDQLLIISLVVFLLIISSYYIYKITTLMKNRSIAKQRGEDFYYRQYDTFKNVGSEVFGSILQLIYPFYTLRNHLTYTRYQENGQGGDLKFYIIMFVGTLIVILIKLTSIILYYKNPFVVTDKYFIINGRIYKSSQIFYTYLDEKLILAKEYYQGKILEILRISTDESKVIQVIQKHCALKDISLITCLKD